MVLSTFNFWSFCGQYRDFHYYYCSLFFIEVLNYRKYQLKESGKIIKDQETIEVSKHLKNCLLGKVLPTFRYFGADRLLPCQTQPHR